ncbi:rhomboid family intramembrane serine protease [Aquirhabdus sp.]|uniref:rhomboid family intramembrane serine protease n=1 Tax=Aquirhabdus sp. TaxID=2824160 RepID=UPI00396CB018
MLLSNWKTLGLTGFFLLINVLVFSLETVNGVNVFSPSTVDLLRWGANFAPLTLTGDSWRLFSNMFLHIGIIHLAVNCWALYAFGIYTEFYYGRLYYLGLYLSAGLVGSLVSLMHNQATVEMLLKGDIPPISAGASGAIMGLGGALIIAAWRPKSGLLITQTLKLKPLLVIMAINFAFGLSVRGIDNAAHFGGLLTGALVGLVFSLTDQRSPTIKTIFRISIFFLLLIVSWIILHQLQAQASALLPIRADILSELKPRR